LLASIGALAICASTARADDAAYQEKAKAYLANVAAPVTKWDGPTSGPKSVGKKLVVIVLTDGRNGGAQGAADGATEAAKALGWEVRQLDGQGSVPGRATALQQAIAMKPAGILNAGIDSKEQAPLFEQAAAAGIKVVGWHAGPQAGPDKDIPSVFTNVTTDPAESRGFCGFRSGLEGLAGRGLRRDPVYGFDLRHRHRQDELLEGGRRRLFEVQGARSRRYADRRPL